MGINAIKSLDLDKADELTKAIKKCSISDKIEE